MYTSYRVVVSINGRELTVGIFETLGEAAEYIYASHSNQNMYVKFEVKR